MLITYEEQNDCLRIYEYTDETKKEICYNVFNYCHDGRWSFEGMSVLKSAYPFRSMKQTVQYFKRLSDTHIIHDDGEE